MQRQLERDCSGAEFRQSAALREERTSDPVAFLPTYGQVNADVDHFSGMLAGKVDLSARSLGVCWTHFGEEGWYSDGVLQATC